MKKHQIALVGGQLIPIYIGVLERKPDVAHLVYTEASQGVAKLLQSILPVHKVWLHKVDAYDLLQIQKACEDILLIGENCEWELNATGGTKIMSLAAISVFLKHKLTVIYIDQTDHLLEINNGAKLPLTSSLSISDFLKLADQPSYTSKQYASFSWDEIRLAKHIFKHRGYQYQQLQKAFQAQWPKGFAIPNTGQVNFSSKSFASWDVPKREFEIHLDKKPPLKVKTTHGVKIIFEGGWWEIVTTEALRSWVTPQEVLMNVILPYKAAGDPKNEIDILINLGRQLVFLDCKAGIIKMDDINKLRVVKDTYGGIGAKAALVCLWKPSIHVKERCKEAGVAVFSYEQEGKSFVGLIPFLQRLAGSKSL